jgi:tRNA-dihydrouridine synthase
MSNNDFSEILDRLEKKLNEVVNHIPYALFYQRNNLVNALSEINNYFLKENWENVYKRPESRMDVLQTISDYIQSITDLISSEHAHSEWKKHLQGYIDLLENLEKEFDNYFSEV